MNFDLRQICDCTWPVGDEAMDAQGVECGKNELGNRCSSGGVDVVDAARVNGEGGRCCGGNKVVDGLGSKEFSCGIDVCNVVAFAKEIEEGGAGRGTNTT